MQNWNFVILVILFLPRKFVKEIMEKSQYLVLLLILRIGEGIFKKISIKAMLGSGGMIEASLDLKRTLYAKTVIKLAR